MSTPRPSSAVHVQQDDTYLPEVWSLYGIGTFVLLVRICVRLRTVGVKGWQGDDYLVFLCLALYTMNAVIVQLTYYSGGNVDVTPDQVYTLSDRDIWVLRFGSKLEFASWYTYPGVIWTLKFQVLFFYTRLTLGVIRTRTIRALFWFTGVTWLALVLTVSLSCRPYHENWQIRPLPGPQCTFRTQNFWTLVVLNVVSDAAIMAIPVPILWNLRVSPLRKLGITLLLCSGLFIISTAIVRAVVTIGGTASVININRWGFRETAVGVCAVTAPVLAPMFTRAFWRKGPYNRHRSAEAQRRHDRHRGHDNSGSSGAAELRAQEEGRSFQTEESCPDDDGRLSGSDGAYGLHAYGQPEVGGEQKPPLPRTDPPPEEQNSAHH